MAVAASSIAEEHAALLPGTIFDSQLVLPRLPAIFRIYGLLNLSTLASTCSHGRPLPALRRHARRRQGQEVQYVCQQAKGFFVHACSHVIEAISHVHACARAAMVGFTLGAPAYYYAVTSGHSWRPGSILKVGRCPLSQTFLATISPCISADGYHA